MSGLCGFRLEDRLSIYTDDMDVEGVMVHKRAMYHRDGSRPRVRW